MDIEDLSQNPTIERVSKMTQDLGQSRTPDETLRALRQGFAEPQELTATLMLSTRALAPDEYRVVQFDKEDDPETFNGFPEEGHAPVRFGGVLAEIIARRQPKLVHNVDWSQDPFFSQALAGCSSVMALPLNGERLPMNWVIMLKEIPLRFEISELARGVERAALASSLLENQMLAGELERANKRIDFEARQVGELQRALLPETLPRIAGLEVAASYEPSGRAGGDLYDFFPLDPIECDRDTLRARWCVFVADTAGHNLAAAVVMAIVQAVLHAHPEKMARPSSLLIHANRQLCDKRLGGFVTAFLGVYEPASRRLTYASAGHPPPLLRRSLDGSIIALDQVASFPLGIDGTETFEEANLQLEPGDTVLLYTDGITEARDDHDKFFDRDRLIRALRDGGDHPAAVIDHLRDVLRTFQHNRPATDDQTLVAARVL